MCVICTIPKLGKYASFCSNQILKKKVSGKPSKLGFLGKSNVIPMGRHILEQLPQMSSPLDQMSSLQIPKV